MILRNCALRHGRQAIAAPFRRSTCPRALSTTSSQRAPLPTATTTTTTTTDPPTAAAGPPESPPAPARAPAPRRTRTWIHAASRKPHWKRNRQGRPSEAIATSYRRRAAIEATTGHLGGVVTPRARPALLLHDPPRPEDVTLELLLSAQVHMGHHAALWNPENQRYIYGVRAGIHIISLEETAAALRRAARVVEEVAFLGGLILFVGTRRGQMEIIARAAELAGGYHLFSKWVPGTITNRDQILGREQLRIVDERDRALPGWEKHLLERRPVVPDLVVVMNPLENFVLLHECAQENIPTIGLVDTNADPTKLTYIIPGNDDSLRSVSVIAGVLGRAGHRGQVRRKKNAAEGVCTWNNAADIEAFMKAEQLKARAEEKARAEAGAGAGGKQPVGEEGEGGGDRVEAGASSS